MKTFKTILLAGAMALPLAATAYAADNSAPVQSDVVDSSGLYVRGDFGASYLDWATHNHDTTWTAGGGIGYQFNDFLRSDVTADWSGGYNIGSGATLYTTAVLGNVYLDWKNSTAFTPYIGGGVGYGWAQGPGFTNDSGLAFGLTAGVSVDMTSNLALDVGYHYRDIMISGVDPSEHQVTAGLRFKF